MTPARHRLVLAALPRALLTALLALLLAPAPAAAQSKSDAFAGKIPPVSAALYRKAGRWEVGLSGNLSVNDPFYNKYFGGLKVGYHFTETLSVHALVAGGAVKQAGSAVVCPSGAGCHPASDHQMWQVPGRIATLSGLELAWAPVYGKLDVFSEQVGHFDLSLLAGVDWIRYQRVVGSTYFTDSDGNPLASVPTPPTVGTVGGHLGVGTRFFFSQWVAARLEFKDYLYQVSIPNWQEGGGAKKDLQNQLFVELGVSFFFPLHNRPVQ
jgi:outer membrane beta-barrel protein